MSFVDALREWANAHVSAENAVTVELVEDDEENERSAWVVVRSPAALGQLAVSDNGRCEVNAHALSGGTILHERLALRDVRDVALAADELLRKVAEARLDVAALQALKERRAEELREVTASHAVILHLVPGEAFDLGEVEAGLDAVADKLGAEYDGNELATDGSEARFFLYGEDADALFKAAAPGVQRAAIMPGSYAIKRFGDASDPSAREERIKLK